MPVPGGAAGDGPQSLVHPGDVVVLRDRGVQQLPQALGFEQHLHELLRPVEPTAQPVVAPPRRAVERTEVVRLDAGQQLGTVRAHLDQLHLLLHVSGGAPEGHLHDLEVEHAHEHVVRARRSFEQHPGEGSQSRMLLTTGVDRRVLRLHDGFEGLAPGPEAGRETVGLAVERGPPPTAGRLPPDEHRQHPGVELHEVCLHRRLALGPVGQLTARPAPVVVEQAPVLADLGEHPVRLLTCGDDRDPGLAPDRGEPDGPLEDVQRQVPESTHRRVAPAPVVRQRRARRREVLRGYEWQTLLPRSDLADHRRQLVAAPPALRRAGQQPGGDFLRGHLVAHLAVGGEGRGHEPVVHTGVEERTGEPVPRASTPTRLAVAELDLRQLTGHRVGGAQPGEHPEQHLVRAGRLDRCRRCGGLPRIRDDVGHDPTDLPAGRLAVDRLERRPDGLVAQDPAVDHELRRREVREARGRRPAVTGGGLGHLYAERLERPGERRGAPGGDCELRGHAVHAEIAHDRRADRARVGGEVEGRVVIDLDDGSPHVVGERAAPAVPEGSGEVEVDVLVRRGGSARARLHRLLVGLFEPLVEVPTPQQRGSALLPGVAQERRQVTLVAPQVAHHRQVGAAHEAEGEEPAVQPARTRPSHHVDPGPRPQQVEQLGVDVTGAPGGGRPTSLHQPVELDHDAADPHGEAHAAVQDDGDAQVLHVGVVALRRRRHLTLLSLTLLVGASLGRGAGLDTGSTAHGSSSRPESSLAQVRQPGRSTDVRAPSRGSENGDAAVTVG